MKYVYLTITVFFSLLSYAQPIVNFTDNDFKLHLLADGYDTNFDGNIQKSEIENITDLVLGAPYNITSLGIVGDSDLHFFNSLESLTISGQPVINVDILSSTLKHVNASGCTSLLTFKKAGQEDFFNVDFYIYTGLQTLDVSECTALYDLNVEKNLSLGGLNLSGCINLHYLNTYYNSLISLDLSDCSNLITLECSRNDGLISLTLENMPLLKTVRCWFSGLENITCVNLPLLETLDIRRHFLDSLTLNDLPKLYDLKCSNDAYVTDGLTTLILTNLPKLQYVDCNGNDLITLELNNLPLLESLYCGNNELETLELVDLPYLTNLSCAGNNITSLDFSGVPTLESITCGGNPITSLDVIDLPQLATFSSTNGSLTDLNFYNVPKLSTVNCSNNSLVILNASELVSTELNQLTLNASNNPLERLYIKNGVYDFLTLTNTNLQYICEDDFQVPAIAFNYPGVTVNSYCSFLPGGVLYNTVTGNVNFDAGADGCDTNDAAVPSFKFTVNGSGGVSGYAYTNQEGEYIVTMGNQNVTITPTPEQAALFTFSPPSITQQFTGSNETETVNFCVTPNGNHPDLNVFITPLTEARPGFDTSYKITVHNKGNQLQAGSVSLQYDDAILDYVDASVAYTSAANNSYTWDFDNLIPMTSYEFEVTFNINSPLENPAVSNGDILPYVAEVTSLLTDETPADNLFNFDQVTEGSFDPNDKSVAEGAYILPEETGNYLHYTIRFQNTGTLSAINVVVKDILEAGLDWATFMPVSASHDYRLRFANGTAEFFFDGIGLPAEEDDEPGSHGYVTFKVKPAAGAALGDTFENTAEIYFDYNAPIVTNTVSTHVGVLSSPDFDFSHYITAYPNPAKDNITLTAHDINITGINIYNMQGQLLLTVTGSLTVNTAALASGSYVLETITDKGTASTKIIKM